MRHTFGGSPSDWTMEIPDTQTREVLAKGGVQLTFWSARTGGFQYTDLILNDNPVTSVFTGDGTSSPLGAVPEFLGPDADPPIRKMYCQAASTPYRFVLPCTNLGESVYLHESGVDPHGDRAYIDGQMSAVVRKDITQTSPGAVVSKVTRNWPILTTDSDLNQVYGQGGEKISWQNETGHYRAKTYSGNPYDPQYRAIAEDYQMGHPFQLLDNKTTRNTIWGITPDGATEIRGLRMGNVLFLGKNDAVPAETPPNTLIVRL